MNYETIVVEQQDGVKKITLNRAENANALNMKMGEELMKVAIDCHESENTRAVLLTGKGPMFSAGGDLRSFSEKGDRLSAELVELTTYLHAAVSRFARMDAPLVIAVNGMAAGAGMSLAICGDYVMAAESARFTMAYTKAGLSPDGSSTYYLPRLIGVRRAKELMITNRILSATEALNWGIVNKICQDEQLINEAEKMAQMLAAGPTLSYGVVKELVMHSMTESLESQMENETQAIAKMARSSDAKEGISAFLEKRNPQFQGR
ncbi:MAG: enoyl-CoA hydratase/isomerase family protein [SAR324 cluster bacterium]|nr:enoyl-CoA hydratase/isomerase family protein [SAR324 cluster bacterium]